MEKEFHIEEFLVGHGKIQDMHNSILLDLLENIFYALHHIVVTWRGKRDRRIVTSENPHRITF